MERDERGADEEVEQEPAWREPEPEPAASSGSAEPESPQPADEAGESQPDYYAVLGVPPGSDRRTIAQAYDRLSRELQPDVSAPATDPERMLAVNQAFDFLDDGQRRADYNRSRGITHIPEARRGLFADRRALAALGLILSGVVAIAAAGTVLVLSLTDDGGTACRPGDGQKVTTANGVEYEDITICGGPALTSGDQVEVNYVGRLEDGTEFANTYNAGDVFRFPYGQASVINGWDEGLAGMTVGSKRRIKIPSSVYGEENVSADVIPPGSTLVFEVEVVSRTPNSGPAASPTPALPTQVPTTAPQSPPEVTGETITTASGLKYIDIEAGTGATAEAGRTVVVNYTGWLQDGGTKFDSSLERSEPLSFPLGTGGVIAGWDEGVAGMKVGGKRRLIIPPELGYGADGYPPVIPANAALIFDVELLDVR
jgi:peptidylprolyl isomerase